MGSVDILVNNDRVQHTTWVEEFPQDRWDEIVAVNQLAAFHASAVTPPVCRCATTVRSSTSFLSTSWWRRSRRRPTCWQNTGLSASPG